MKKILLLAVIFLSSAAIADAQYLIKQWDHTYGGNDDETVKAFRQTADGGFLIGGYTRSDSSGEISTFTRGGRDMWIVKTDTAGVLQWESRFGGSLDDRIYSFDQLPDGGYVLGGWTASDSGGDLSTHTHGSLDFLMIRTDAAGNKLWDQHYGGNDYDWGNAVRATSDGGFILGGYTFSDSSGDVSSHGYGGEDFWVIKTDSLGNKLWDHRYGGNQNDELYAIRELPDGSFILGGRTFSDSTFDVTVAPRGNNDYWIIKIDNAGNKLWDARFGGNEKDNLLDLQTTSDGGFILGGFTVSDSGLDVSEVTRDTSTSFVGRDRGDAWIVKTDSLGIKQWDHRFGGSWVEDAFGYVNQTTDGGYLFGCASYSNISGDKTENDFGYEQSWIVKTDSMGIKQWDKTIFSDGEDEYAYPIQTSDGCYAVANWSYADSSGYKSQNSRGYYDFWLIKFCETSVPQLPVASFVVSNPSVCAGGCFTFINTSFDAGTFHWFFPGGTPDTSSMGFPDPVCYTDTGTYSVTLVATNAAGSDTVTMQNIVYVVPLPVIQITQVSDTLFATQGLASYQWYDGTNPIPGDTNYFSVINHNGTYYVLVTDSNSCPASDSILVINLGLPHVSSGGNAWSVYPNPAHDVIEIKSDASLSEASIELVDVVGHVLYSSIMQGSSHTITVEKFAAGVYFIHVRHAEGRMISRIVIQ